MSFVKEILKIYVHWGRGVWGLIRLIVKKIKAGFKNLMAFTKKVFGKKPVKLLSGFLKYAVVLFLGTVVLLSLAPLFSIPGFQSLVVMSGSMEPEIRTGSVVVVRPSETLVVGDVITFARPDDPKNFITHRIESIDDSIIKTKGDANNAADNWEVHQEDVQGKVAVSVPYLGYAVHFAKTQRGFVLLILLPALLIILDEVWAIKKEMEKKYEAKLAAALKAGSQKKGRKKAARSGAAKKAARSGAATVAMLALGLLALGVGSGQTAALLSDTEESVGNTITVGVWDVEEDPPSR